MSIRRLVVSAAVLAVVALHAAAASAVSVSIGRLGFQTWELTDPEVVASTTSLPDEDGVVTWALAEDFVRTAYTVTDYTVQLKEDPFVTNNITLTNTSGGTATFTATVLLPITAFAYDTVIASSLGVTVTDSDNDGLIYFDNLGATPIYSGFVNFPVSTTLLTMDPVVPPGGIPPRSYPIDSITDCFPASFPGCSAIASNGVASLAVTPGVASFIGLTLVFQLGDGDSVGITSRFEIVNVPEPATVALLGVGLAGLALARRRAA